MKKSLQKIIGIDEVGRGPIAGPVAVGAFIIVKPEEVRRLRIFRGVKESKQLSEIQREEWFSKIQKARDRGLVDFAVRFQSEKIIDSRGISYAIKVSLARSLEKVVKRVGRGPAGVLVLLDGGLRAPAHFKNQKTIIRGDTKETTIALASICAKVLRDRQMIKMAHTYPNYHFEIHKGYGTKAHYAALKKHGFSPIHRLSFCKKLITTTKSLQKGGL